MKIDCSLIDFNVIFLFSDTIIGIFKITELWKYLEKKTAKMTLNFSFLK